jgi:hypothetical protein
MSPISSIEQERATLEQLQHGFVSAVVDLAPAFSEQIRPSSGLAVNDRLDIYRYAYRERLIETLQDSYAHTASYLGDEAFRGLALAYIDEHRSAHYSLRFYGADLAPWVALRHPSDPEVAELAALDWALRQAFDCANAAPLAMQQLAALSLEDWDRVGFVLHPSFALLTQHHNTVAIWQALDQEQAAPATQRLTQASTLLIWRREWQPHFRTLDVDEALALQAIHQQASFAKVCAQLALRTPQETEDTTAEQLASMRAGAWLHRWLSDGLVCALS